MSMTFGFIGCGNMGGALAKAAVIGAGPHRVALANRTPQKAHALAEALGCKVLSNEEIAAKYDFIFLGVKPQMMADMLEGIAPFLEARTSPFVLVSMAAGLSIERIRRMAGGDYPVLRIMPNTPCAIGRGMTQFCAAGVEEEVISEFLTVMEPAGRWDELPESLMDAASSLSGSGPAFTYMFIEALADGAVACGLPRAKAQEYAAQMVAGAAQMVLESGKHPGQLKDDVCSPGGTTVQGVMALEEKGFRSAAQGAVTAAYRRNKELAGG